VNDGIVPGQAVADYSQHRVLQAHQHIAMLLHERAVSIGGMNPGPETQVGAGADGALMYSHNEGKGTELHRMGLGTPMDRYDMIADAAPAGKWSYSGGEAEDKYMTARGARKLQQGAMGERDQAYNNVAQNFIIHGATFVSGQKHAERNIAETGKAVDDEIGGTKVRCYSCAGHLGVQETNQTGDGRVGAAFSKTEVVPAPTLLGHKVSVPRHDTQTGKTRARSTSPARRSRRR
jgi:hypothetical protein